MNVEVRPAHAEDCAAIADFRSRVEGGDYLASIRGEAFYRHKYLHLGRAFVIEKGGQVAGTMAATPRRITVGSQTLRSADLGDLFISPEIRGRGLFRRLHSELIRDLEEDGVRMLTVRPGPASEPLLRQAFGYQTLFPIKEWVAALDGKGARALPLGHLPVIHALLPRIKRAVPAPPPGVIFRSRVTAGTALPRSHDGGWPLAGTVRDATWLADRYTADPTPYRTAILERNGRIAGVVVYLILQDRGRGLAAGWIVDAWSEAGADLSLPLAAFVMAELRREGASVVHFWSAQGPPRGVDPMVEAFRSLGMRGLARGGELLYLPVGRSSLPEMPDARLWMFRIGDTDGI